MESWSVIERVRNGVLWCAGLGIVAGAFESVHLATSLELPLTWFRFVALGVVDLGAMALVGALFGAFVAPVHLVLRSEAATALAAQMAGCTLLLTGYFLWQGGWWIATVGQQPIGGAAMAAMPIGFAGVAFFNARFLIRRAQKAPPTVGWLPAAAFAGILLVFVASLLAGSRNTGGGFALEGDANVVLVTVDGLRSDQAGTRLEALAAEGVVFENAVSPTPGSRAANATALVGLHPLRHGVLDDSDVLRGRYRSLFESLQRAGWATGGFVSSRVAEVGSGLEQGFLTYDDDFFPWLPGVTRVNVLGHLLRLLPAGRAALARRDGSVTVARFASWLREHADKPVAAWVHLADVQAAIEAHEDPGTAVQATDAAVGAVLDVLEEVRVLDKTLVIVAGTHGALLGSHGGHANVTLYDEAIRVPLILRVPGPDLRGRRVDAQVRLMDLPNTALHWLELDRNDASEGMQVFGFARGERSRMPWCGLVGRDLDGDWLLGLRNNGIKYIRHLDGREELYDVGEDPAEMHDLSDEQAATLEQARQLLASDLAALKRMVAP